MFRFTPSIVELSEQFIPKIKFPTKLWEAINQHKCLIAWSEDGLSVVVEVDNFEETVMTTYPGLVKIPGFANFRRQMRWYGFKWKVVNDGHLVFRHPCFQKNREDLLQDVVPRKRNGNKCHSYCPTFERTIEINSDFRLTRSNQKPTTSSKSGINETDSIDMDNPVDIPDLHYHYVNGIKRRKYRKKSQLRPTASDVAVQTSITMCSNDTHFLGSFEVNNDLAYFYEVSKANNDNKIIMSSVNEGMVMDTTSSEYIEDMELPKTSEILPLDINDTVVDISDLPIHYFADNKTQSAYYSGDSSQAIVEDVSIEQDGKSYILLKNMEQDCFSDNSLHNL